ncbi:KxYKxGKxW signal peptide domain-containing protein, partial [Lactobacillus sp. LC28-10]
MVGKNNHIRTIKSNLKEHYKAYKAGRRWLYASLASLALGAGLLLGGSMTASADVQSTSTQDPVDSVGNESGDAAAASQKATAVSLKTSATSDTSNKTAADSSATTSTSDSNGSANTANTNDSVKATQVTPVTSDNNAENTATTQTTSVAKAATDAATSDTETTQKSATTQSAKSETLVDPTEEQLDAAKANAEQVYATTNEPQEIDAVAPDSAASLTLSATAVGHGTNAKSPLTLTLTTNAKAGDVYVINIPASTQVYTFASADPLVSAAGTTTVTQNPDKSTTVTDTFTADSTTTQLIKLNLGGNYAAQDGGMPDVGKTLTKTITWSINKVAQTPLTFTQTIQPTTNLTTVSMIYPDGKQVSQILPNQNYVFNVAVNEANGVQDDSNKTPRVNSADNYGGATVTIPVPTGFVLDTDSTSQINELTDGSTITQPNGKGTDVIITVPAKAGNQGWQDVQPYKIVGAFDVPQTTTAQTLTAPGDVTFSQVINSDGDKLTDSADPWSVVLIPNQGGTDVGNSTAATKAKGNSTNTNKFVLDTDPTDDPKYLATFGFTYNSAAESTDTKLQITIPDGLNATSIQTPATAVSPSVYLPDTTSYTYTLTLADGTTETGTVNAGDKVTPTDKSAIRTAVFIPNKLAPGSNANQLGGASSFIVDGNLSTTYDNGSPVKNGDTLVSTMDGSFDADGKPLTGSASVTQTVVEATSLGVGYVEHHQTQLNGANLDWNNPGNPNAGTFKVEMGGNRGQTTYNIFEPIFYFVIPKSSTVASTNQPTGAKISEFTSDDGHTVVKFDYTGSGVTIDTHAGTGTYGTVTLANNPDALPGNYPFYMYIVSPTTKIANDTPAVDSTYVENNPNAFLMGDMGSGNWNITTASSFFNTSLAKGNQNVDAITKGTSDDQGDSTLNFYDSVVYTSLEDNAKNSSASVAINLPTVGDSKGSQYTFNLKGPIDVPTDYTVTTGQGAPINPTVLYSTQPQAVNANATTPDTTGYVTADQVGDNWSSIRSIIIQMNGIQPNTSTGRIKISGTTDNFNEQAGKTGYLQTIFYGNGANASVNSNDASIKITGTSTIKTRYHYTDSNGDEKYIDLDDLSKTLNDNADTFTNDYPTQLSEFSAADQALIPTGYKLVTDASGAVTPTIVDGSGDGAAEFGQVAQYYYDGDFVQYDLVANTSTQVKFVDDDNKGAVVGTPKNISGIPGSSTNWDMGDVPTGYRLAAGSATTGSYTFQEDNNVPVQIHLNHIVDRSTATTTRTITYVVDDPNYTGQVPETQTQTIDWKIVKDEATGVSAATPQGAYYQQTVPTIDGYTANKTTVPQEGLGAVKATDLPKNEDVTVTYKANAQTATVEYVDDENNGAVVGTPTTLNGQTFGSAAWTADNVPAKYVLAKGQAASGTYQFT